EEFGQSVNGRSDELILQQVYYLAKTAPEYFIFNAVEQMWMSRNESGMKRYLKSLGYSSKVESGDTISELDSILEKIQTLNEVSWAGTPAGYQMGVHDAPEGRILVR